MDFILFGLLIFWGHLPLLLLSLPPSPDMYSNYTETAADLYIVFGSNSMERLGTVANLVSLSPLLCKFIKGGRGVVKMFTKL